MRAQQSAASSRVFERPLGDGSPAPYYEYRDTAMSSSAPYKPEWIKELRVVADNDPANPDVAFNKGHLLHQLTFFVGAVNFYWIVDGKNHCMPMSTGDSCYITPFVPHSFTSRNAGALGLILAVTYAGRVRHALESLSHYTATQLEEVAASLEDTADAFAARLARHRDNQSLSVGELSTRLQASGVERQRADTLATGRAAADATELTQLADALLVREADLVVNCPYPGEEIVTRQIATTPSRNLPDTNRAAYKLTELAKTRNQPELCGFDVELLSGEDQTMSFRYGLHEYLFNYGESTVEIGWGHERNAALEPGDSAYIRPKYRAPSAGPGQGASGDDAGARRSRRCGIQ